MKLLNVNSSDRVSAMVELMSSLGNLGDPRLALEQLASGVGQSTHPRPFVHLSPDNKGEGQFRITQLSTGEPQETSPGDGNAPVDWPDASGILADLIHTPVPKIVHELDLRGQWHLPPAIRRCRSAMAMPVFLGQAAGEWVVLFDRAPNGFGPRELEELLVRSVLVGTLVNNLSITQQLVNANLRVQSEISAIAAIQQGLLPEEIPQIPGLRLATSYESVGQAGGDMFDFLPLGRRPGYEQRQEDHRWAILIGDVSGHGPAAAMVMAMMHSILHAYPTSPSGPAEVLRHVNQHLCSKRIGQTFITAFLGFYEPASRQLTYARAGHPPPLLLPADAGGQSLYLDEIGDLPLGIMADCAYAEGTLELHCGQRMVLYTDGITEARNPAGEYLDLPGLLAASHLPRNAQDTLRSIQHALLRHTGRTDADDDQTIVVLEAA